jgi:nucleoside-diphosphate-sugar epimerase
MTRALVTGAPGWLGTQLVLGLVEEGRDVRVLSLPGSDMRRIPESVDVVHGDLRDPDSCAGFVRGAAGATLFHCAGIIHPGLFTKPFEAVNVRGAHNIVAAAEREGLGRIIAVSSNSPLGVNPARDHVFDETAPYNPYMGYGKSKMGMEKAVMNAGIPWSIIRPPWFYGVGQPARQTLFFEMIRTGKGPIVGDGNNLRSMAYVDNIVQGLKLCESVPAAEGEVYWIADERPYTMNEIVDTVERLMRDEFGLTCDGGRLRLPDFAAEFAVFCDTVMQAVGLYHQKVHVLGEMNKTIACRIDKAQRELGYAPEVALEEGMRRSIAWWLETSR